ncbi:MAG: PadR family transcriptional regulator [Candidatus Bathyarchaeota archaeon]|jgi:PadR family transcriptional regulator PadR|nr:PadR family transcriptional regulator [Candidatus Bathyarchaeota archaeon]
MNAINRKDTQTKIAKGLLDMIILQYLQKESMYGYQLITNIRKGFGIYFGPSTIYPLLGQLEKQGYVQSAWNMESERPRKIYKLTELGKCLLSLTEESLIVICQKINPIVIERIHVPPSIYTLNK